MCIYTCTHTTACMWRSEDNLYFFYFVGPRDQTQAGQAWRHGPYLLNHHANIEKIILVISNIAEVNEHDQCLLSLKKSSQGNTNWRPLSSSLLGKDGKMWAQVAEARVHPS